MSNANHIQHTGAASSNPFLAIAAAYGDYTKKSFEDTKLFVEKLCGARSLDKAIEVQTEFAKTAYETFVTKSQTIAYCTAISPSSATSHSVALRQRRP